MRLADNQPNYYTSRPPPLKEVGYNIIARGPVEHTDEDDLCDPTKQVFLVGINHVGNGEGGGLDIRGISGLLSRGMSPSPCHCERDCCGHRHGYASVEFMRMDTAIVTVFTSKNY